MAGQHNNNPISLGVIAERQDLSQNYLEQLFIKLRKGNLVKSVRGPGGGYMLAKEASNITIGEVFSAVDESIVITECAEHHTESSRACAKLHDCRTQILWAKLMQHYNYLLYSITIDDVVKGKLDFPYVGLDGPPGAIH